MDRKSVTATEFQNRVGTFMDMAAKEPIFITKHGRPVRVLLDVEEYERLKRHDPQQPPSSGK